MKLSVVFEPDDGGWHVYVPSLQGCRTWGRSLTEARRNIREAISLCEEELGDAEAVARDAVFEEDIRLDPQVRSLLVNATTAKAQAEAMEVQAKSFLAAAARALTKESLSLRDAGELLGLSQEGVRKLVKGPKPVLPDVAVLIDSGMLVVEVKDESSRRPVNDHVTYRDVANRSSRLPPEVAAALAARRSRLAHLTANLPASNDNLRGVTRPAAAARSSRRSRGAHPKSS